MRSHKSIVSIIRMFVWHQKGYTDSGGALPEFNPERI